MEEFYKILVVDDEILIRQGIIHYVDWESNGYQIVGEAANGEEAIEKIEQLEPHILLTDIVMPKMDGIELIQFVKKFYPSIMIVVLSSYDEFDYVRQTFQLGVADYILKPKLNEQEVLSILNRHVRKHRKIQQEKTSLSIEEVLGKMLQGYATVRESIYLSEKLEGNQLLLIEIFTKPGSKLFLTENKLTAWIERRQLPIHVCGLSTSENGKLFLLYGKDAKLLHEIAIELEKVDQVDKITIGEPFSNVEQMKSEREKLEAAKKFHFYMPEKQMIHTNQLPQPKELTSTFDFHHFIHLLHQRQFEPAIAYTQQYLDEITKGFGMDILEFQSWLGNVCFNLIVHVHPSDLATNPLETQKYDYIKRINTAFDVREALLVYEELLMEARDLLWKYDNHPTVIEQIQQYIEKNYNQPLTLESLSKLFHFHPSYLSSYFSKHTKLGVNEYLHQVRITRAKELLKNGRLSVSSISEKVGYSDPSYFTKVFKKNVGISPRIYRKRYVSEWKDAE